MGIQERNEQTRRRLMDVAAQIIAERGVDALSLREVASVAGQRNHSAVQYHFGSKEGLIDATYRQVTQRSMAKRDELFADVQSTGDRAEFDALIDVLVRPTVEGSLLRDPVGIEGRFLSQLIRGANATVDRLAAESPIQFEVGSRLIELMGDDPLPERILRLQLGVKSFVHMLADLEVIYDMPVERRPIGDWNVPRLVCAEMLVDIVRSALADGSSARLVRSDTRRPPRQVNLAEQPESTRRRLMDVASRTIAEKGCDALSLREVAAAAGQRNHSAVQYHFGSKQGLIDATYRFRLAPYNEIRAERFSGVARTGDVSELIGLVDVLTRPLVEGSMLQTPVGDIGRFLSQMIRGSHSDIDRLADEDPVLVEIGERILALMEERSPDRALLRLQMTVKMFLHMLADLEVNSELTGLDRVLGRVDVPTEIRIEVLLDMVTAAFTRTGPLTMAATSGGERLQAPTAT